MKQIVGNMYLRSFKFLSSKENTTFLSNQDIKEILVLNDYSGDNYYCYICYNSLSQDKKFIVSFSTDEVEDNLNFLFWRNHKLIVFDTGSHIYIVDEKLNIVSSFEVTTPLIGFHLIDDENILFG